jgi:hypothetical protein
MRCAVFLLTATLLAACASDGHQALGTQPAIRAGSTVIALVIVPGTTPGTASCQAKLSRDPALVAKKKRVLWEILDLCNEGEERPVEVRFTGGALQPHLRPHKKTGKVKKGQPDYLEWEVGENAGSGQYADYQIWLGDEMLVDPRIQVP